MEHKFHEKDSDLRGFTTFRNNLARLWSLIVGLKVTGKFLVSPQITVHYPRRTVENISTFHGPIELVPNPNDPAKPKCIACLQCASACPSSCLTVVVKPVPKPTPEELQAQKEAEAEGEKVKKAAPKEPGKFTYDFTLCSLCGICVGTCPVGSLRFSTDAYLASTDKRDFFYDLLARLTKQASRLAKDASRLAQQASPGGATSSSKE
jgi:NADH-quinone oxidoreductase subunit I